MGYRNMLENGWSWRVAALALVVVAGGGAPGLANDCLYSQAPPTEVPTQRVPLDEGALVVRDFDGDGHLDVISGAQLCFGDGARGFSEPVALDAPGPFVARLSAADVDGDGDSDLIVGGANAYVLSNDGDAGFTRSALPFATTSGPYVPKYVAADVDGDGDLDLGRIVGSGALEIARNDGVGGFSLDAAVDVGFGGVAVGDIDADGRDELLVGAWSGGIVLVEDDGAGIASRVVSEVLRPPLLSIFDADGDGDAEIVVATGGTQPLEIDLPYVHLSAFSGGRVHAANLDGDGVPDLVVQHPVAVVRGRGLGGGEFECTDAIARAWQGMGAPGRYPEILDVAVGDFDHDGVDDVVVAKFDYGADRGVHVYFGWPDPPPQVDELPPVMLREAGLHEVVVTGRDFLAGEWTAIFGERLADVTVERESAERLRVRLTVASGAGSDDSLGVSLRSPDLRKLRLATPTHGLDVVRSRGRVIDRSRPERDFLRLRGRIETNDLIGVAGFHPGSQGLRIEIGTGVDRRLYDFDERNWRRSRRVGMLRFRTARDASPRIRCSLDTLTGRFVLRVSRTDLVIDPGALGVRVASTPPSGPTSGPEIGTVELNVSEVSSRSGRARRVLRLR